MLDRYLSNSAGPDGIPLCYKVVRVPHVLWVLRDQHQGARPVSLKVPVNQLHHYQSCIFLHFVLLSIPRLPFHYSYSYSLIYYQLTLIDYSIFFVSHTFIFFPFELCLPLFFSSFSFFFITFLPWNYSTFLFNFHVFLSFCHWFFTSFFSFLLPTLFLYFIPFSLFSFIFRGGNTELYS